MIIRNEKPLGAVGQLGVEHRDDLDRDDVDDRHVEHAGVAALDRVERDEPAARRQPGVDLDAQAGRRFEAERRSTGPRLPRWNFRSAVTPSRCTATSQRAEALTRRS